MYYSITPIVLTPPYKFLLAYGETMTHNYYVRHWLVKGYCLPIVVQHPWCWSSSVSRGVQNHVYNSSRLHLISLKVARSYKQLDPITTSSSYRSMAKIIFHFPDQIQTAAMVVAWQGVCLTWVYVTIPIYVAIP